MSSQQALKVVLLFLGLLYCSLDLAFGYFELEVHRMEQVEPSDFFEISDLKVRKSNGTRKIYGFVRIGTPLNTSVMAEAFAYVKRGGQYQRMPFKFGPKSVCEIFEENPYDFVRDAASHSSMAFPFPCPFPAGPVEVFGYYPSFERVPMAIMPSGDYSLEFVLRINGTQVGKTRGYGTIHNI